MRNLIAAVERLDPLVVSGRVAAVNGLLIEARGGLSRLSVGARAEVERAGGAPLEAEVVGFRDTRALLMPFGAVEGVAPGAEIRIANAPASIRPHLGWKGRIVDAFGRPIDGKGPLPRGAAAYPLRRSPPPAHARGRVGERLSTGVRAMDVFTTLCRGQRMGIFAGSGVGKSVLLSMLAKGADCDAVVVGLIGERGREVREFVEETLGAEGLERAVVVVATSDEPALTRRQAAYTTLAIAEMLRDQDQDVLLLMDSVTRFAMAQREIGLAAGEPPTTKGYTPTCFTELPKLLERAGPGPVRPDGTVAGAITALFTVLVDGDDHNEPVADAVRGILDGHIVMERAIAERGRFPAINVLKSISRTLPACQTPPEREVAKAARQSLSAFSDMEELIRIGAYRAGADAKVDRAIALNPALEAFLSQDKDEATSLDDGFERLASIVENPLAAPAAPILDEQRRMSWAQSLVKLTAYEVEILQKRLAEIAARRDAVAQILQALDMEEALEAAHASGDAEAGWYLIGFRDGLKMRRAKALADQKALAAEEQGCRDALQESFEAQKKYEQVVEADGRTRAKVLAAREGQAMDASALRSATFLGRAA